jgi:hypothetical protein
MHTKSLFSVPFNRAKDRLWTPVTDQEQYFYPITCVFPLGQYANHNKRYTGYSFIEVPPTVVADCRSGKAAVLLYETWEGEPWWHYMEMINSICMNNEGLRPHHFIMVSGNMNMPTDIPYKHIAITWLQTLQQRDINFEVTKQRIMDNTIRDNKFLCMSRRPAPHRLALLYHLWEYKEQGIMSFSVWEELMAAMYKEAATMFEFPDQARMNIIKKSLPIVLDDGIDVSSNPVIDTSSQKFEDSFLHIVPETYYGCTDAEHSMFFSEKMFKPIQHLQPFVVLNYPHSLLELRNQGYQTFNEWFDESYDTMTDLNERTIAIAQIAKNICNQSPASIAAMHKDMLPVLEHNYHQRIANTTNIDKNMYDILHTTLNTPL